MALESAMSSCSRIPLVGGVFGRHGFLTHFSSAPPLPRSVQWTRSKRRRTSVCVNSNSQLIPMDSARIKVVGIGGGGNNAVNRMIRGGLQQELKDAFAPLNDDEEADVSRALNGWDRREVLVMHENSNIEITREKLRCLVPSCWLNDEVINLYLELLKEREKQEPDRFLKCHFFNTFFYKKLYNPNTGYDYKAVRRWTTQRKIGYSLIDCEKIFVPIHKQNHWCLAVIDMKAKKFQYLDSLGGSDLDSLGGSDACALKVLARYISDEAKDKTGKDIDVSSWEIELVDDLPRQEDGSDCGMFMIKYAYFYSRGLSPSFSQTDMPYFRKRTAKEILRLKAE